MDASLLTDYVGTEPGILNLVDSHLGALHVVRDVLDQVDGVDEDTAAMLGIEIVEPTYEDLTQHGSPDAGISGADFITLIVAGQMDAIVLTHDGSLGRIAHARGLQVWAPFQLLAELVECGRLGSARATQVAESIREASYGIPAARFSAFTERISKHRPASPPSSPPGRDRGTGRQRA